MLAPTGCLRLWQDTEGMPRWAAIVHTIAYIGSLVAEALLIVRGT